MAVLALLAASPAHACEPLVSAATPAVLAGYVTWLVLAFALRDAIYDRALSVWVIFVPIGFIWTLVPMLIVGLPFGIAFYAFPMHLVVESMRAVFGRVPPADRKAHLLLYGVPALIVLVGGLWCKVAFYAPQGGLRKLLWTLSANYGLFWFTTLSVIGAIVALRSMSRDRARAEVEGSAGVAGQNPL